MTRTNAHWVTLDFAQRAKLPLRPLIPPKPLIPDAFKQITPGKSVTQFVNLDIKVATPLDPRGYVTLRNLTFYVIPEGSVAPFEWSVYVKDTLLDDAFCQITGASSQARNGTYAFAA